MLLGNVTPPVTPPQKPQFTPEPIIIVKPDLSTKSGIISYIKTKDWDSEKMTKIIECESGFNTRALNINPKTGDYSVGLTQVNLHGSLAKNRPSKEELFDAKTNLDFAYKLWKARPNYSDWTCAKKIKSSSV